ncbi:MAG: zf-HC2 domain-containing protein [Deltaproteobacteria bacterium]|nr:zf-HC2 domain-containing protein [Deltaproteobacteria bacterium]
MNCQEFEAKIEDLFLGELSGSEEDRMENHIAECSHCEDLWMEHREIQKGIQALAELERPSGITTANILKAANDQITRKKFVLARFLLTFTRPAYAGLFALVLTAGLGIFAHHLGIFSSHKQNEIMLPHMPASSVKELPTTPTTPPKQNVSAPEPDKDRIVKRDEKDLEVVPVTTGTITPSVPVEHALDEKPKAQQEAQKITNTSAPAGLGVVTDHFAEQTDDPQYLQAIDDIDKGNCKRAKKTLKKLLQKNARPEYEQALKKCQ